MFYKPREDMAPSATESTKAPPETRAVNVHPGVTDDLGKAGF